MPKARQILIVAAAGLAISMLPVQFDASPFDGGMALAKNGNGGGNGGGKGGGGDRGGGKSADSGKSGGKAFGGGKSSTKSAKSSGKSEGGLLKSLVRGNSGGGKSTKTAGAKGKSSKKADSVELPLETAAIPAVNPEEKVKNMHARMGRLNSLKRNINAYMSSSAEWFAPIQEYVLGAAEARNDAAEAQKAATAADEEVARLETRLADLQAIPPDELTEQQTTELAGLPAAIETAKATAATAKADADAAIVDPVALDEQLIAALQLAVNPNRELDPVADADIVEWAREVLDGKIAEAQEILAKQAADEGTVEPVTETTDPVEPDPELLLPEGEPAPEM